MNHLPEKESLVLGLMVFLLLAGTWWYTGRRYDEAINEVRRLPSTEGCESGRWLEHNKLMNPLSATATIVMDKNDVIWFCSNE